MINPRPYRAIPIDGKKFVYGWYFEILETSYILYAGDISYDEDFVIGGFIEVIPSTVGQQVGLKDKHGRERYAGDIESDIEDAEIDGDRRYEIVWCNDDGRHAGFFWKIAKSPSTKIGRIVQLGEPDKYFGSIHQEAKP